MAANKIELASPEWLAGLEQLIGSYLDKAGRDVELSICEVFTGVPQHLDKQGTGKLAWYCRIRDSELEFAKGEIDDAEIMTVADYQFILPFARSRIATCRPTRPSWRRAPQRVRSPARATG